MQYAAGKSHNTFKAAGRRAAEAGAVYGKVQRGLEMGLG